MKLHDLSSIKHLWDLLGRTVMGWNDVNNFLDIEPALHKKCYKTPMVVIQRLISSMMRHCAGA